MSTGNTKTKVEPLAVGLRFEKDRLIVSLDDDREVSVPLSWYPSLQKAGPAQRKAWRFIGGGVGFHWKSLDLDLSVEGLVNGFAEMIPSPPPRRGRARSNRRISRDAA